LGKHYAIISVPHVVLIDRAGQVRLIQSGSSKEHSRELRAKVIELLKESSSSGPGQSLD